MLHKGNELTIVTKKTQDFVLQNEIKRIFSHEKWSLIKLMNKFVRIIENFSLPVNVAK